MNNYLAHNDIISIQIVGIDGEYCCVGDAEWRLKIARRGQGFSFFRINDYLCDIITAKINHGTR